MRKDKERTYIAIDLKSFYASVECVERGLDPLKTNLVVADESRTDKTICLAVSPSLKAYGIPGRARLFEVRQRVREINTARRPRSAGFGFTGKSIHDPELKADPNLEIDFLIAPPRMSHYIDYSAKIYKIYLNYLSANDIHVYSIDEVFMDVTDYLPYYKTSARDLAMRIIRDVLRQTGVTATCGIGTNLYLCKIAMDVLAKHIEPDADGVRIAELDEMSYRRLLWDHRPLTDFWRVGRGTARRLETIGVYTMGQIARLSLHGEEYFYKLFGVGAELLIDHAWGWEPCSIADIKAYRPGSRSLSNGQVLSSPYPIDKARVVITEMADSMVYELMEKGLVAERITVTIGYDAECLRNGEYDGPTTTDRYGRRIPKHSRGTAALPRPTSSRRSITSAVTAVFDRIAKSGLLVRRMNLACEGVTPEDEAAGMPEQLDIFADSEAAESRREREEADLAKERRMQQTLLGIRRKYGKNAVLRGLDFEDGATAIQRNNQIGGHKA